MANVLPKEERKKILASQRARFLFAFSTVALGVAFICYFALMPSYFFLVFGSSKVQAKEHATASTTEYAVALRATKNVIDTLRPLVYATTTPSKILGQALAAKPSGVVVDRISFATGKKGTVTISGSASRPAHIETYRLALDEDSTFETVSVPVNSLVGSENGAFTLTLTGSF